jgi:hypothetical protein
VKKTPNHPQQQNILENTLCLLPMLDAIKHNIATTERIIMLAQHSLSISISILDLAIQSFTSILEQQKEEDHSQHSPCNKMKQTRERNPT